MLTSTYTWYHVRRSSSGGKRQKRKMPKYYYFYHHLYNYTFNFETIRRCWICLFAILFFFMLRCLVMHEYVCTWRRWCYRWCHVQPYKCQKRKIPKYHYSYHYSYYYILIYEAIMRCWICLFVNLIFFMLRCFVVHTPWRRKTYYELVHTNLYTKSR